MATVSEVIQRYVAMRDFLKVEDDKHAAKMKPYRDAMEAMENWALGHLNTNNEQSIKTEHGTVFKKEWTQSRLADKEIFVDQFICSADDLETLASRIKSFFTAAVSKDAIKDYMAEHDGALPPGVDFTRGWAVQFNRPR